MQIHTHTYVRTHTCMQLQLYANADPDTLASLALLLYPALPMQSLPMQSCTMQIPSPGPQVLKATQMASQGLGGWEDGTAQRRQQPASLAQPLALVLVLTWEMWVFKATGSAQPGNQLTLDC